MHRIGKLLWMIFIFGIVFFIICDEKWYKIQWDRNRIVFNEIEKKSDLIIDNKVAEQVQFNPNAVYKNSDIIRINPEFQNPKNLRKGDWVDRKYLAKIKKENRDRKNAYTWSNVLPIDEVNTISSVFQWVEIQDSTWTTEKNTQQVITTTKNDTKQNSWTTQQEITQSTQKEPKNKTWVATKKEIKQNSWTTQQKITQSTQKESKNKTWATTKKEIEKPIVYYPVKKYEYTNHGLNLSNWVRIPMVTLEKYPIKENLAINLMKWTTPEPVILYKNSNKIQIYSGFENPINMLISSGMDEEFLARQKASNLTIISLNDNDTISSTRENSYKNTRESTDDWDYTVSGVVKNIIESEETKINNFEINNNTGSQMIYNSESDLNTVSVDRIDVGKTEDLEHQATKYKVKKYEYTNHSINLKKAERTENVVLNNLTEENYITIDKPKLPSHTMNIRNGKEVKPVLVNVEKYQLSKHSLKIKKWVVSNHSFIVENTENNNAINNWLSDSMLESLLENEEIDINTLESENDEFLQKVFEKTKDKDVMNLIVETYLNEYQFVKAKKFVESLSDIYFNELNPLLNLRVAFNSFPLSSKTINENLSSIVQDYASKNKISDEDKNRYLGVIALIDRNYDKFFEISAWFRSEKYKAFALKIQWYKNQIAKQMWMPEYYFDTLVALELFNQWLFQPAKVLSLYSLQQNPNYILPYQVLAYANFLTNSRDTSIEYLKRLVDIDSNNAEKYRYLMWVAFYRDEKYEQSVVMLSMVKDENLRLDAQRYLINNYLKLNQKNRLISTRNKLLWYKDLVASDFYTYFYETFFHPYAEWSEYQLYAFDTELANKMLRACSTLLPKEERAVCTYWTIGRNIALWQFEWIEQYLLNLVSEYPQWYLYQALWEYYIKQWNVEKAKAYLLKAVSMTKKTTEVVQIKKLLEETM